MTEINNCPINPVELKTTQFMHTAIDQTNVKGKICINASLIAINPFILLSLTAKGIKCFSKKSFNFFIVITIFLLFFIY